MSNERERLMKLLDEMNDLEVHKLMLYAEILMPWPDIYIDTEKE